MFSITRQIIDWCDTKFDESIRENNCRKAFMSGAVEGFVDMAIVMYLPVTIACYIWKVKATKKQ